MYVLVMMFDYIIMHVMNQGKNVECMNVQEFKECEWSLKNIVIFGIKMESMETPRILHEDH